MSITLAELSVCVYTGTTYSRPLLVPSVTVVKQVIQKKIDLLCNN